AFLGSAHVTADELIPGRLLSPIEIQDMLAVRSPVTSSPAASAAMA
ncbi:MAG: tRNA pseudouridine(55) synthase TruB, partial [Polaromonas sp.]|nr:tRNA pseudouridine(55) synthase TruB [Polaromonas sp.]